MNREETKKCIAVMQAFVDGETVVCLDSGKYNNNPRWNWRDTFEAYVVKQFEPERGDRVMVSKGILWFPRTFVVCHKGVYYCDSADESIYYVPLDRSLPVAPGCF